MFKVLTYPSSSSPPSPPTPPPPPLLSPPTLPPPPSLIALLLHTPLQCRRLFYLIAVWKFIGQRPSKALVYFIFIVFLLLNSTLKQWYLASPVPPTCRTSPLFSPPLQAPIFGWLLCVNLSKGGHLNQRCISCLFIFRCSNFHPNNGITFPPRLPFVEPPLEHLTCFRRFI